MNKKNDLSLSLRRVRKSVQTNVNTQGGASRKTQCGGTIIIMTYTLDTSYAPDQP